MLRVVAAAVLLVEVVVQVLVQVEIRVLAPALVLAAVQVWRLVSVVRWSERSNVLRALFQSERCELQSARSFSSS